MINSTTTSNDISGDALSAGGLPKRRESDAARCSSEKVSISPAHDAASPHGAQLFAEAAERVLDYLKTHTPLTDWSVSRVVGSEQVHLHVRNESLLSVGDRVDWDESFCSRMSAGAAHVVRNSRLDSDYSDLKAASRVGAYAGYTLSDDRGSMFGVLCGVRARPLDEDEVIEEQLLKVFSELLSTQLSLARIVDRERRRVELAEVLAERDALTDVMNRRGWDRLVRDAQERLDNFGDPVAVAVIDLDGLKTINDTFGHAAGDDMIKRASQALRSAATERGHVARYGGDEFTVLVNGVSPFQADEHFGAFEAELEAASVPASLGYACAEPGTRSILEALEIADRTMYERKRHHLR